MEAPTSVGMAEVRRGRPDRIWTKIKVTLNHTIEAHQLISFSLLKSKLSSLMTSYQIFLSMEKHLLQRKSWKIIMKTFTMMFWLWRNTTQASEKINWNNFLSGSREQILPCNSRQGTWTEAVWNYSPGNFLNCTLLSPIFFQQQFNPQMHQNEEMGSKSFYFFLSFFLKARTILFCHFEWRLVTVSIVGWIC